MSMQKAYDEKSISIKSSSNNTSLQQQKTLNP